jgi:hypothetical protein
LEFSATALTEAQTHLHQLHQRLEQSNPALYRDLALYLQVLRAGLPQAVQQASFHLATQVVPARYMALDTAERLELQRRLQQLVQRCSALLTVEQLIVLARQVRSEQQRLRRREQKRLLAAMAAAAGEAPGEDDDTFEPVGRGAAAGSGLTTGLPRGSVQLGMDLPLSADLFAAGLPGLSGLSSLAALTSGSDEEGGRATTYDDTADDDADTTDAANDLDDDPDGDETDDDETDDRKADDREADDREPGDHEPGDHEPDDRQSDQGAIDDETRGHRRQRNRLGGSHGSGSRANHAGAEADSGFDAGGEPAQMLQALFAMASEAMGRLPAPARDGDGDDNDIDIDDDNGGSGGGDSDDHGFDDGNLDDDGEADGEADPEPGAPTGGSDDSNDPPYLLPRQPLELLHWWGAFDLALQRRLRNLSHAINLELLHLGLTRSLLPASLLDAVLRGQIEALPAPANLLRLSLPFGPEGLAAPVEALGLLLRSPDLEVEQPRLRTCRRRLEERRSELRTVARNYRHWQRRTLALEAEQQWLQDSRTAGPVQP